MSGKFMKVKKFILSAVTMTLIVSQLIGCAAINSTEMMDILNNGEEIEIMVAMPDNVVQATNMEESTGFKWERLGDIERNEDFRRGFEKAFGTVVVTSKDQGAGVNGPMFIKMDGTNDLDADATIANSLRNKVFMETIAGAEARQGITEEINKVYTDAGTGANAVYAALNEYYNLFEGNGSEFKSNQSVSREDFYSLIYRASNTVGEVETNDRFDRQVGGAGEHNKYASQVEKSAWLNVSNDSLKPGNYKASITRAEAIYLVMNYYLGDYTKTVNVDGVKLSDAKDGGTMLETGKEKLQVKNKETKEVEISDAWQLGVLAKMQQGTKGEVHTDIYKALVGAYQLDIISSETNWNTALTKFEAIDLIYKANQALNNLEGYKTEKGFANYIGQEIEVENEETGVELDDILEETKDEAKEAKEAKEDEYGNLFLSKEQEDFMERIGMSEVHKTNVRLYVKPTDGSAPAPFYDVLDDLVPLTEDNEIAKKYNQLKPKAPAIKEEQPAKKDEQVKKEEAPKKENKPAPKPKEPKTDKGGNNQKRDEYGRTEAEAKADEDALRKYYESKGLDPDHSANATEESVKGQGDLN